jgi:hypothetical protein
MKTTRTFRAFCFQTAGMISIAASLGAAGTEEKTNARADVTFFEPERFTDVRDTNHDSDRNRDAILRDLKTYLQERAEALVPQGTKLFVTITDIDMAGDFEPGRGAPRDDVRIVKQIYPPRIKLSFRLTGAKGEVLKQGDRELTNPNFMMELPQTFLSDPYRYEKTLIDDWLRSEMSSAKKKSD